jgi:hypothetical protein
MNITIWNTDNDFMPVEEQDKYSALNQSVSFYKARQNWFYLHCMKTIQNEYAVVPPPTTTTTTTTTNSLMNDVDPTATTKTQLPSPFKFQSPPGSFIMNERQLRLRHRPNSNSATKFAPLLLVIGRDGANSYSYPHPIFYTPQLISSSSSCPFR